jgi:phosphatidylglycerol---prolipoprotein diacylglyceryl transferase
VVLSALVWWIDGLARARGCDRPGLATGLFLVGYAIARFSLEFTRQPDVQLGLVFGPLSMGQLLSIIMLAAGLVLLTTIYFARGEASQTVNRTE